MKKENVTGRVSKSEKERKNLQGGGGGKQRGKLYSRGKKCGKRD